MLQKYNTFYMGREREHVDRLDFFCLVLMLFKICQISCQCFGIAGDINDTFRFQGDGGCHEGFCGACSWRVHEDDIGAGLLFLHAV